MQMEVKRYHEPTVRVDVREVGIESREGIIRAESIDCFLEFNPASGGVKITVHFASLQTTQNLAFQKYRVTLGGTLVYDETGYAMQ